MAYHRLHKLKNYKLIPSSCYNKILEPNFYNYVHSHQYIEIMYCRQGNVQIVIKRANASSDETCEIITLHQNQFILIDAGIMHTVTNKELSPALVSNIEWLPVPYTFSENAPAQFNASDLFRNLPGLREFVYSSPGFLLCNDTTGVESQILSYISLISDKNSLNEHLFQCLLISNLIHILKTIEFSIENNSSKTGLSYLKKAEMFITKNLHDTSININDVAEHAGISKSYLQRLFKKQFNMSILQYINSIRINKCKQLLTNTKLNLDTICKKIGFNNPTQLRYVFKKVVGITPSQYRNNANFSFTHMSLVDYYESNVYPEISI